MKMKMKMKSPVFTEEGKELILSISKRMNRNRLSRLRLNLVQKISNKEY
jgi:hypothetical protein